MYFFNNAHFLTAAAAPRHVTSHHGRPSRLPQSRRASLPGARRVATANTAARRRRRVVVTATSSSQLRQTTTVATTAAAAAAAERLLSKQSGGT